MRRGGRQEKGQKVDVMERGGSRRREDERVGEIDETDEETGRRGTEREGQHKKKTEV